MRRRRAAELSHLLTNALSPPEKGAGATASGPHRFTQQTQTDSGLKKNIPGVEQRGAEWMKVVEMLSHSHFYKLK